MDVVIVFGPPAVGKMTVGRELRALTGWPLLHNHLTIEPLLEVFAFGTPPFVRLVGEFRTRIVEEAIAADLPGLVATFVWALQLEDEVAFFERFVAPVLTAGGCVRFVELIAPLAVRQDRNNTEARLAAKPSKRDRTFNDANLLEQERHVMNTGGDDVAPGARRLLASHPHLRLDNGELPAAMAARRIVDWLEGLPD